MSTTASIRMTPAGRRRAAACLAMALVLAPACAAQPAPPSADEAAARMRSAGLTGEGAYEILASLTGIGPRLTGSPEAAAAVDLTRRMMIDFGFENVRVEPVEVGHWVRGDFEEAEAAAPGAAPVSLAVCALGGSIATPPGGLTAAVVEVKTFDELDRLGEAVRGRIVFFNRAMDRTLEDPFAAYGQAADQRVRGAAEASRRGARAVLVRSLTFRVDGFPYTGLLSYAPAPDVLAAVHPRELELNAVAMATLAWLLAENGL